MTLNEKKLKELGAVLEKNNSIRITQAIGVMRNEPPFSGAIALLISHYDKSTSYQIRQLIREFMNDMKDQASCSEVVAEIKRGHSSDTLQMIASSCWQSGLDYSAYCQDFTDLFLAADYMTALECFTVIDSSAHKLGGEERRSLTGKLKEGACGITDEKSALCSELISVLQQGGPPYS